MCPIVPCAPPILFLCVTFGLIKCLKTCLYETSETLYNDIWVIDWATTDHEAIRVGYSGTQLGHITRASTSTEKESIRLSISLVDIVCVLAAQRQLAAVGKTNSSRHRDESDERITNGFSEYDRLKQIMLINTFTLRYSVREMKI